MTFDIDGVQMGEFSYAPTGSSVYKANWTVFSAGSLALANHILTIKNGHTSGGSSLIILDSIIYSADVDLFTTASSATTSSSSATSAPSAPTVGSGALTAKRTNTAAIAGGVLAAMAVLLLLGLAFLYRRHRQNQHRSNVPLTTSITPISRMRSIW